MLAVMSQRALDLTLFSLSVQLRLFLVYSFANEHPDTPTREMKVA